MTRCAATILGHCERDVLRGHGQAHHGVHTVSRPGGAPARWSDDGARACEEGTCATCDADYVQKRRDQFGDTPFGWERGLK